MGFRAKAEAVRSSRAVGAGQSISKSVLLETLSAPAGKRRPIGINLFCLDRLPTNGALHPLSVDALVGSPVPCVLPGKSLRRRATGGALAGKGQVATRGTNLNPSAQAHQGRFFVFWPEP